jgi:hypothetical protein
MSPLACRPCEHAGITDKISATSANEADKRIDSWATGNSCAVGIGENAAVWQNELAWRTQARAANGRRSSGRGTFGLENACRTGRLFNTRACGGLLASYGDSTPARRTVQWLWAAQVGGSKKRRQAATPFRPARFTETDSMKHFLITPVLTLAALLAVGCGHSDPIRAEAPGGRIGQSHHIKSDGTYALYHVTQWTDMGQPKAGRERLGWVLGRRAAAGILPHGDGAVEGRLISQLKRQGPREDE